MNNRCNDFCHIFSARDPSPAEIKSLPWLWWVTMALVVVLLVCMVVFPVLTLQTVPGGQKNEYSAFGYECYYQGIPAEANPYQGITQQGEAWLRGWLKAKKEVEK